MVVNHHLSSLCISYCICHPVNTRQCVKIKTTDYICLSNQLIGKLSVFIITNNIFCSRHPPQKVRKCIRYNHIHGLAMYRQKMIQAQRRTQRISVRRNMGHNHHFISPVKIGLNFINMGLKNYF